MLPVVLFAIYVLPYNIYFRVVDECQPRALGSDLFDAKTHIPGVYKSMKETLIR